MEEILQDLIQESAIQEMAQYDEIPNMSDVILQDDLVIEHRRVRILVLPSSPNC